MHHQRCQNRKQDDIASQFGDRFNACMMEASTIWLREWRSVCADGESEGTVTSRQSGRRIRRKISEVRYKERYKMKKVYPEA